MLWHYVLPAKINAQLENQFILTTLIGDKVSVFQTTSEKKEKYTTIKKYFMNYALTIKVYSVNMNIEKIIEGVKTE